MISERSRTCLASTASTLSSAIDAGCMPGADACQRSVCMAQIKIPSHSTPMGKTTFQLGIRNPAIYHCFSTDKCCRPRALAACSCRIFDQSGPLSLAGGGRQECGNARIGNRSTLLRVHRLRAVWSTKRRIVSKEFFVPQCIIGILHSRRDAEILKGGVGKHPTGLFRIDSERCDQFGSGHLRCWWRNLKVPMPLMVCGPLKNSIWARSPIPSSS